MSRRPHRSLARCYAATALALVALAVTASPALADNCGTVDDCLPSAKALLIALAAVVIIAAVVAIAFGGPILMAAVAEEGAAAAGGGIVEAAGATTEAIEAGEVVETGEAVEAAEATQAAEAGQTAEATEGAQQAGEARTITTDQAQMEAKSKHASDFGVQSPRGAQGFEDFRQAVTDFVNDPATIRIDGTYRGDPAILNYNPATRLVVVQQPTGEFVSGWQMSPAQLHYVQTTGSLGGG